MDLPINIILCTTTEPTNRRMVIYKIINDGGEYKLYVTPPDFAPAQSPKFKLLESAREYVMGSVKTFHLEIISDEQEADHGCCEHP